MQFLGILIALFVLAPVATPDAAADPNDAEHSKDPPIFNRMPGFHIYRAEELAFDRFEFETGPGAKTPVEGKHTTVIYYANEGALKPSGLQVTRNYTNAIKAIGGKQVYAYEDGGAQIVILKAARGDREVWARIHAPGNDMYTVEIIEKQAMEQDVVASAAALAAGLADAGKVAVYGIYFETGKAVVKPESEPALVEITKLLAAEPALKLHVVGHTDSVGNFDANLKLSRDRGDAVVKVLTTKHKVAAARLRAGGVGPLAPVASNKSEEGRAKNRRVELVAQ